MIKNYTEALMEEYAKNLEEIYITDFKQAEESDYYHFYLNLIDLINSLDHGVIYSAKNDKQENVRQYDTNVPDGTAYVCMTNSLEGKRYIANDFNRPVGIAFNRKDLQNLCDTLGYKFNPDKAYSKFGDLIAYKTSKDTGIPTTLRATQEFGANGFYICSIGQLADDLYFICSTQGGSTDNYWPARLFSSKTIPNAAKIYTELKNWFIANMNSGVNFIYYWFQNGYVGNVQKTINIKEKICPIAVDGNLNKNYKPRAKNDYKQTINFTFKGQYKNSFKEVIGYGPIKVKDEQNNTLLYLDYTTSAKGGYKGPQLLGKNIDTGAAANKSQFVTGNIAKSGDPKGFAHLLFMTDQELFDSLCKLYNEHEYRVYIPSGRDMYFRNTDIKAIILPVLIKIEDTTLDIKKLVSNIANGMEYSLLQNKLKVQLIQDNIISAENPNIIRIATKLISLLTGRYKDVYIEFNEKGKNTKIEIPKANPNFIKEKQNKQRQITTTKPDLSTVIPALDPEKQQTWLAKIKLPDETEDYARIGSEIILAAKDNNGQKYVLFIYKSKAESFMELPGGGFANKKPTSESDFEQLIKERLKFKCNIDSSKLKNFTDTNKGLLLYEVGVTKKDLEYDWSYYKLYTAEYSDTLSENELDYNYNNKDIAKQNNLRGYNAYMRWISIEDIDFVQPIAQRYANILDLIK